MSNKISDLTQDDVVEEDVVTSILPRLVFLALRKP